MMYSLPNSISWSSASPRLLYLESPLCAPTCPQLALSLRFDTACTSFSHGSSEMTHPAEAEGKVAHLLFGPNLLSPSRLTDAVKRYLSLKLYCTRPMNEIMVSSEYVLSISVTSPLGSMFQSMSTGRLFAP